ncbi:UV excision repair protein RAD23 homolog B OS=Homo sapiens GN=RAD23B PE=1 SV=1 [Rhizoctonia solani AG-1 IB]|uniref:UV excision repair protein RAD23 homolog B n=1 Tax=Thanatephorus cucumeris (strain AG1-IB / isolate 7/3/14) TaxID=1108050 RepID=A0A0B7FVZ0_THACB|nr:UV excision repair protein RAD23 homolog B OS=Homo sapiens GN=RAD23B PE=1 SV=1 [Rhizoctonia solani AG-1 IB]
MKITLRTLQQDQFELDIEPHETVLDLKQKVGSMKEHPVDYLKLFYAGRTLRDEESIESLGIRNNAYIVVMLSKPRTLD